MGMVEFKALMSGQSVEHETRLEEAIAAGCGLPLAAIRDVLEPVYECRVARRVGTVARSWSEFLSRHPLPARTSAIMLRAASRLQHDARRGSGWAWVLRACEQEYDDALAHWIAGMSTEDAKTVRAALGVWDA